MNFDIKDLIFSVSNNAEGELFSINRFSVLELFDNFGVEVKDED